MMIHVIGASGRSGASLCRALLDNGIALVPVVRDAGRWVATGLPGRPVLADVTDASALRAALGGATHVVSCAHARHAGAILAAAPQNAVFVLLGSTRKFSRWPDAHGGGVLAGEAAFLQSGRRGVMLHPTMIYGAQGEDNVQRLAKLLRLLPVVPLPQGGKALVQPIHQDDVTACVLAALRRDWQKAEAVVIAGAEAVAYADFVRAVAKASGRRAPTIVSVPGWAVQAGAALAGAVPGMPRVGADEVRRLMEDKAFSVEAMVENLGVRSRGLAEGLASMTWGSG